MSLDLTAMVTTSKKQGKLKRTMYQCFTQDEYGSVMIHGSGDQDRRSMLFVKTPSTGWYYSSKVPFITRESFTQQVELTDGRSFNYTYTFFGEEKVSTPAGIFNAIKKTSSRVLTLSDSKIEQQIGTSWIVPDLGSVKEELVFSDDKMTMRLTLEMVDTNIPYQTPSIVTYTDPRTGLMWATKDNGKNINWYDAKAYCENYRVGGFTDWRMPTQNELAGLYDKSIRGHDGNHLPKEITLTGCCIWASETRRSDAAYFNFFFGERLWFYQITDALRALPVRSAK